MVVQPSFEEAFNSEYYLKGKWNTHFFQNTNPIVLELGCGKGEYTTGLSQKYPGRNFIGIDIKGARMWRGALNANKAGLKNAGFLRTRIEFIRNFFSEGEVSEIWVTFPDPQLKQKRHKKRLTGAPFLNNYREFIADNGLIHLKTDNRELYEDTLDLVRLNELEIVSATNNLYNEEPCDASSIQTFYESMFRKEGIAICYLSFRLPRGKVINPLPHEE